MHTLAAQLQEFVLPVLSSVHVLIKTKQLEYRIYRTCEDTDKAAEEQVNLHMLHLHQQNL